MKVALRDRKIPVRPDGYPDFQTLTGGGDHSVQAVFTDAEAVELVNRALYQLDYQKVAHAKYQQRQRDFQAPIKLALKELFPSVSWLKATPEQVQQAMERAYPKTE